MSKGSCMCGEVGYEYTGEPAVTALCHCTDCQKWSGSAYTSNVVVPRNTFKVTKGSPKSYDAKGDSGKINKHWFVVAPLTKGEYPSSYDKAVTWQFFCGNCGSSMYTELEVMPDMTCVKAGTLDGGLADIKDVGVEFYTKDRVNYSAPVASAKQEKIFG